MQKNRMFNEETLLSLLNKISKQQFEVPPDIEPFELIKEVCRHLGNPNPVLRDELGYSLLAEWIYKKKTLNHQQLRELYSIMVSNHMWFCRIGEINTDSVFMRSFTSLGITLLLLVDIDTPFLTIEEWEILLERTVVYCTLEKDLRGYVEENGWLHAAAHAADVLNAFAKHPNFSVNHTRFILTAINKVMENALDVFRHEEDERLARAIANLIENKHLPLEELITWFEQANIDFEPYIVRMTKRINWKHLLRSCISQLTKRKLLTDSMDKSVLTTFNNLFDSPYI
ncbi:DUF2785 domain-containing protein [Paenibacillus solisilvae]|uniref:DUF2785 domain-containing protein n=1 Tax=Paenibacillus solisilvae TaxID=2486751 RepID=A0ABW0W1X4_9BACL